jgi:hypothetical protein
MQEFKDSIKNDNKEKLTELIQQANQIQKIL